MADDTNTAERETLMDLIDAYAEARHLGGCHTYNANTAEARAKVVASLAVGSEAVGEVESSLRFSGGFHVRLYRGATMPEPGTKLYTHPSPPEGMAGWISVDERLPEPGQTVAFVVDSENWATFKYLHGRVLGGSYLPGQGFSVPGLSLMASLWMPLPPAPPLPASEAKEL